MKFSRSVGVVLFAAFFSFSVSGIALARESNGTAAAKAEYEKGQQAFQKRDFQGALDGYRKAIELDPYYAEAHKMYVHVSRVLPALPSVLSGGNPNEDPDLNAKMKAAEEKIIQEYEALVRKDPRNEVYEYGLGWAYYYRDHRKSEQHYLKAIALEPACAHALFDMSLIAEMQGNMVLSCEYMKKAAEAAPDDENFASSYVYQLGDLDKAQQRRMAEKFAERFPKSSRAPGLLARVAQNTDDPAARLTLLERIHKDYPKDTGAATELLNEYGKTDPAKALALAHEVATVEPRWKQTAETQQALFDAGKFISDKKYAEAAAILDKVKPERRGNNDRLELLKAEALNGQQQTGQAYDSLAKVAAITPTDLNLAALLKYGAKLDKTSSDVQTDVARNRSAAAKPIQDFSLEGFGANAGKKLSLADFKGKVVLLNFWYPG